MYEYVDNFEIQIESSDSILPPKLSLDSHNPSTHNPSTQSIHLINCFTPYTLHYKPNEQAIQVVSERAVQRTESVDVGRVAKQAK